MSDRPTPKGSMLYEARSQVKVLQKLLNDAERERDEAREEVENLRKQFDPARLRDPMMWHIKGFYDGDTAALARGGTNGAEWHADQKGLTGEDREDYISGFNEALDEYGLREEEAK